MDKIEKEWEYKGLKCVIIAMDVGHRCGYVKVPQNNRFYKISYGDVVPDTKVNLDRPMGESFTAAINVVCGNKDGLEEFTCTLDGILDIHGGLTYSREYLRDCEEGWWLGFDCAHCDDGKDLSLITDPKLLEVFSKDFYTIRIGLTIWTLEMVIKETEKLAEQIYKEKGFYEEEIEDASN
jgi:hypothetical protein